MGSASAQVAVADYSIASVEYAINPLDKVGKLKAGLLCLPKGTLRWRDIARSSDDATARSLDTTLIANGLSVGARPDPLFADPPPLTKYRIRVTVERVKLNMCVEGLKIGLQRPSGSGVITVKWETFDRLDRRLVASNVFEVPIAANTHSPGEAGRSFNDALSESAVRYTASRH